MKKIYLTKVEQKGLTFYSMVADPRLIVKMRKDYKAGAIQDVQRPWIENKVKEIAYYVGGHFRIDNKKALGIIPNSPILNFKKKIAIQEEKIKISPTEELTLYYVELPETEEELLKYEGQMEIIDGQHRIIAFDDNYLDVNFDTDQKYEMNFSVFSNLTDNQRKEIFMVTNEKQDKVATNLLRYIRRSLGLLDENDSEIYDLLEKLNTETSSPLHDRVIFGANKIRKGYSETQLAKIFKLYGVKKFFDNYVLKDNFTDKMNDFNQIMTNYFEAWESAASVSFQDPGSETITKISGLRYLLCVFSEISVHLISKEKKLTKENYLSVINAFPEALDLENIRCVFHDDSSDQNDAMIQRGFSFRGEGATIALAKQDIARVLSHLSSNSGFTLL